MFIVVLENLSGPGTSADESVVAVVKTRDEDVKYHPDPGLELDAGDVLVVVGPPEGLRDLVAVCASPVPEDTAASSGE